MSLADFQSFIEPGAIKFYVNAAGYITCDRKYHEALFKLFVIVNWKRFSTVAGNDYLENVILNFTRHDELLFTAKGDLYRAPLAISQLLKMEKRREYIFALVATRPIILKTVSFVAILVVLLYQVASLSYGDRLMQSLYDN